MAAPDEKKTTVKRGFTKRAGKKVRRFLQRARGKKDNHAAGTSGSADDDDDDEHNMKHTTSSTSNLSQTSLTTTETDEDEFHDALMKHSATSSSKDSKFSDFQSSIGATSTSSSHHHHARPEKTADRSIIAPHDGYRSRKTSTTSNLDHYDRQRASFDRARNNASMERQRAVSSPKPTTPPSGVFANKQSSSILVAPAAAPGPSPPISPTSPTVPLSASDYSLTTRSVEELSVASLSLRREEDHKEAPPPLVVVPSKSSSQDNREVDHEENNNNNNNNNSNSKESKKEKEEETNKEQQQQQQQQQGHKKQEEEEENILMVDENSYVLPTKASSSSNAIVVASSSSSSTPSYSSGPCNNNKDNDENVEMIVGEQEVSKRVAYFDKKHRGKITMLDTFTSLRELGYHWMFAIPATLIMHLRLSPLTTLPQHPRSVRDWFSLPIYTERVAQALTHHHNTLLLHRREQVSKWVDLYGRNKNSVRGLTFWDGFRALRGAEKTTLRWWQLRLWLAHRLQWILTYSMLHDPQTRMVTQPALEYLCPACPP